MAREVDDSERRKPLPFFSRASSIKTSVSPSPSSHSQGRNKKQKRRLFKSHNLNLNLDLVGSRWQNLKKRREVKWVGFRAACERVRKLVVEDTSVHCRHLLAGATASVVAR